MSKDVDWAGIIDAQIPPEDMIAGLVDIARNATTFTAKGEAVIPDRKTRLTAFQALMLHRRGRPSEAPAPPPPAKGMKEELDDLKARAEHSPALRALLRELGAIAEA